MKELVIGSLLMLATAASAQVGIQTGCFGPGGQGEHACVGETVTCISRFVNDSANGESWTADSLSLMVFRPSGDLSSGELLASPVEVPAGSAEGSFAEGAFTFVAADTDVPRIFGRARATAFRTVDGPDSGHFTGEWGNTIAVEVCPSPTLSANAHADRQATIRVHCTTNNEFHVRVCRNRKMTFTVPLR